MAQIHYRANISAAIFPLTIAKAGRSVIIPGPDNNFDRRVDPAGDTQKGSVGIPQVIYAENVLPTPDGYQSVGYQNDIAITIPAAQTILSVNQGSVATSITEVTTTTTIEGAVTFSDACDDISIWTKSATYNSGAIVSEVSQSTTVGNPLGSYRLYTLNTSGIAPRAQLYKGFTTNPSFNNLEFSFDIKFINSAYWVAFGVLNNAAGDGLKIWIDSAAGLYIGAGNSWGDYGLDPLASVAIAPALTLDHWYRVIITVVTNDAASNTRTYTATIKDGATTIATVSFTNNLFVPQTHIGFQAANTASAIANDMYIDNIILNIDASSTTTTVTTTEITGITTVYISFFSDNTAAWSYTLDSWDNYAVILPGGFVSPADRSKITITNVRGILYACIRSGATTKIYSIAINTVTPSLTFTDISATISTGFPLPYTINSIIGIVGSYNYLLLYSAGAIFWSSTTTPTDFSPSLVSGAGNEAPGNLKGDITFCKEHVAGFFIYSDKNVLFAQYTGNARYPWKFREVGASGGYNNSIQVSGDTNSSFQYGLNNTKLIQIISPDSAELVAPEVTDFFERAKQWDIFDSATYTFSLSNATYELAPETKITTWFVLDRYLLVPYGASTNPAGVQQWTYVIVYDLLLKRYGKLKYTFDFCLSDEKKIYFINRITGTIVELYFEINDQDLVSNPQKVHSGVLILGKFQYVRSRFISIDEVHLETVQNSSIIPLADRQLALRILPTLDGKTFAAPVTPYNATKVGTVNAYDALTHTSCYNFALALKGAFDLNTVELVFHPEGDM